MCVMLELSLVGLVEGGMTTAFLVESRSWYHPAGIIYKLRLDILRHNSCRWTIF